ncbi:MAG: hypothetical protein ABI220_02865 [Candidatus Saccharimonadales bacterium]
MEPKSRTGVRKVFRKSHDPIWQLQLGVVAVIVLQLFTSSSFLPYNKILIIVLELALLVALAAFTSDGYQKISHNRRTIALGLIVIIAVINIFSLLLLLNALLYGHSEVDGVQLLQNGLTIYITNAFMFALWYWEMDGGGPDHRVVSTRQRDFLFPQMIHPNFAHDGWLPGFTDYLYLSTSNVTNFASADTLPLTHRAKMLMMLQSIVALTTVVLVAARAINILH